ncbi:MAG: hypothetical protein J3K34DRAFT_526356 [Monoraphidium minutum]|nr:MAG: hypothetical protein J3K34DRAFT_526356 [Monoraphidium minutum]
MALIGGEARPLLPHLAAPVPGRRASVGGAYRRSSAPALFVAAVLALSGFTWLGLHSAVRGAADLQHTWRRRGGDADSPWSAAASAAPGDGSGGDAEGAPPAPAPDLQRPPAPGDAGAHLTSGAALQRAFGALGAGRAGALIGADVGGGAPAADEGAAAPGGAEGGGAGAQEGPVDGDIELRPERVAEVVGRSKAAETLQRLAAGPGGARDELHASLDSAGRLQGLYHSAARLFLGPLEGAESAACPPGKPPPPGARAALAVTAGPGGAAALGAAVPRLLGRLGRARGDVREQFQVFIVVDGHDPAVKAAALHFVTETRGAVRAVHHAADAAPWDPAAADADATACGAPPRGAAAPAGCGRDAARPGHQLFLLRLFLECLGYPSLLTLGGAARRAPDGLSYFAGASWLLGSEPSLWCVAGAAGGEAAAGGAGGGAAGRRADPLLLFRSDAVPAYGGGGSSVGGGGVLVTRDVGRGLLAQWRAAVKGGAPPAALNGSDPRRGAAWRRFLASRAVRRGRQCVAPAAPRVRAAAADESGGGGGGGDGGPWGRGGVAWMDADVSWLMEPAYSRALLQRLAAAAPSDLPTAAALPRGAAPARVAYSDAAGLRAALERLGLPPAVEEAPDGYCFPVARLGAALGAPAEAAQHCQSFIAANSYRGVVPAYNRQGARVFLAPAQYSVEAAAAANASAAGAGGGGGAPVGGGGGAGLEDFPDYYFQDYDGGAEGESEGGGEGGAEGPAAEAAPPASPPRGVPPPEAR